MPKSEPMLTVFTIDDSEIIYKNMGLLLAENKNVTWLGHSFSLEDAYIQIAHKKPRLVILDIHLQENNSFDLLEHITKEYPSTVVVMFTNISTEPYRKKCKELGAKYFLDKSDEFEKIPQIVEELLNSN